MDLPLTTPPLARYECKYVVAPAGVAAIRRWIAPFVRHDRHAAEREHGRYEVSSLYLDSPDLALYRMTTAGERNRFKLRVRTYTDRADDPAWLEVKRRSSGVIQKSRTPVERAPVQQWLTGLATGRPGPPPDGLGELGLLARRVGAVPMLGVRYRREAFESRTSDTLRITIDTRLEHAVALDGALTHPRERWAPTPIAPGGEAVLEIKFTERHPPWVADLVRALELRRVSFAKYVRGVELAGGAERMARRARLRPRAGSAWPAEPGDGVLRPQARSHPRSHPSEAGTATGTRAAAQPPAASEVAP